MMGTTFSPSHTFEIVEAVGSFAPLRPYRLGGGPDRTVIELPSTELLLLLTTKLVLHTPVTVTVIVPAREKAPLLLGMVD